MIDHQPYIDLLSGYIMSKHNSTEKAIPEAKGNMPRIWSSKAEFVRFLEDTLIPDLKESGLEFTAEDFETAVYYMKGGK